MVLSSPLSTVLCTSTTSTARRTRLSGSSGSMSKWYTSCSISSSRGSHLYVPFVSDLDLNTDCFVQGNYYIAFIILSEAMEHSEFHLDGIHIVNVILEYFYLGLLILCFILALGNRPQGSKWGYTMAFIGFGFITIYMTVRPSILLLCFRFV